MNSLDSNRDNLNDVCEVYGKDRSKGDRPEDFAPLINANVLEKFQHLANDPWQHQRKRITMGHSRSPNDRMKRVIVQTRSGGQSNQTRVSIIGRDEG